MSVRSNEITVSVLTDREALFVRMWAIAALAHVIGNGYQGDLVPTLTAGGIALTIVSVAAFAALVRPGRLALAVLSATVIGLAVVEVPLLGNHWLLAAMVSVAYLLSGARWHGFEPAARIMLLVFYSYAAFAKVNQGFLDPAVSCSVVYANQTLEAIGLSPLAVDSPPATALPWLVTAVELSVPILLIVRRTRWFGVLLAAGFHSAISLDLGQHFYDFTAVLLALFVLFLPDEWSRAALRRLRAFPHALRTLATGAGLALAGLLVIGALLPPVSFSPALALLAFVVWIPYATTMVALVAAGPRASKSLPWRPAPATWLAIVLVVLNGLTPWTETKTAFGYTMYANLETDNGRTNHLVVPATLPLREGHTRLIAIESSSDPGLATYVDSRWLMPWPSFAGYVHDRPGIAVTYRDNVQRDGMGGVTVELTPEDDVTAIVGPIPRWWHWMPLRSVDAQSPPRCQTAFLPAL